MNETMEKLLRENERLVEENKRLKEKLLERSFESDYTRELEERVWRQENSW
jgi:hypothetical protein